MHNVYLFIWYEEYLYRWKYAGVIVCLFMCIAGVYNEMGWRRKWSMHVGIAIGTMRSDSFIWNQQGLWIGDTWWVHIFFLTLKRLFFIVSILREFSNLRDSIRVSLNFNKTNDKTNIHSIQFMRI